MNIIIKKTYKNITLLLFAACTFMLVVSLINGPIKGEAGDPGRGDCSSCHAGKPNTGKGKLKDLLLVNDIGTGGYVPDSTYNITVAFSQKGMKNAGFQVTALDTSKKNTVGTFISRYSGIKVISEVKNNETRSYISHTTGSSYKIDTAYWSFKWKAPKKKVGHITFYVAVLAGDKRVNTTGDYTYLKQFKFLVSGSPVAKIVSNDTFCKDDSSQFKGFGTKGANQWVWTFTGSNIKTSTLQNPKIVFNNSGWQSVTLVAKNSAGESFLVEKKIFVLSRDIRIFGNDTTLYCSGDSVQLKPTFYNDVTYKWSPYGETTYKIWAKKPGNYQVSIFPKAYCLPKHSKIIVVKENPTSKATLVADKNGSVCDNQVITFTAGPSTADSFYFYRDSILIAKQKSPNFKTKLAQSAKLWVAIKAKNGCSKVSDTLNITIIPQASKPLPNCGKITPNSINVYWDKVKNATEYKIRKGTDKWINLTSIDTSYTFDGLDGNSSYDFEVKSMSLSPCIDTEVGEITCKTKKCNTTFILNALTEVCPNDDAVIKLSNISVVNYEIKIDGTKAKLINTFKLTKKTTYTISVSDLDNPTCPTADSNHTIDIKKIVPLTILYSPKDSVCFGKEVLLSSKVSHTNYQVYKDSIKVGLTYLFLSAVPVTGVGIQQIYVTVKDNGCKVSSSTKTITFLPKTLISFTKSRNHMAYIFTPDNNSLKSYTWFRDGKQFSTDKIGKIDLTEEETEVEIKLIISDENNCNFKIIQKFTTPKFSGLFENNRNKVSVYPIPTKKSIRIHGVTKGRYTIYNTMGKQVLSGKISAQINVKNLAKGIYLIKAEDKGKVYVSRFVKE